MSKLVSKRRVGLRSVFTAAVLLGGALPAAGAEWLFPVPPNEFYDIGANWDTGTAPGVGDAANFLGANTGNVQWDDVTGDTSSASLLIDTADVTFFTLTGVSSTKTHTTTDNTVIANGGVLNLGLSATQQMNLDVGGTLDIQGTSQFVAQFGSQVTVGNDLFVGDTNGQSASATFDGAGTMLTLTDVASLGAFGSTGTLSFTNGATGNLMGALFVADDTAANTAGVLNVTGGSVVTAADIDAGILAVSGVSGTILVDGTGSRITQTGSSTFDLGAVSLGTGMLTLTNGGRFDTGTGTTTINATGTLDISSNGQFFGRNVQLAGTANVNGGILFADHLQLNGGALNTDGTSSVAVNSLGGFGSSVSFNGFFTLGAPAGAATATHTVGLSDTFNVGATLAVGDTKAATLTVDGGTVTAGSARIAGFGGSGGSTIFVINGGSLAVDNDLRVGGSFVGPGEAGTLDITGFGSSASVDGTLRIFSTGTVNVSANATLNAHHIDATGGGAINTVAGSTIRANNITSLGSAILTNSSLRMGIDLGTGVSSHTVGVGETFDVGNMKVGTESGAVSTEFNVDGGQLTVTAYLDVSSSFNGDGGDATFRVLNGGLVNNGNTSDYGSAGGAAATLVIDGAGSQWNAFVATLNRGTMTVANGGTYSASSAFTVGGNATVNLNPGATFRAETITHNSGGAFNFNAGTLRFRTFDGNLVNAGGTLAPQKDTANISHEVGQLTVNGDYTQQSGGNLFIVVNSDDTPGTTHSQLDVNGLLSLDGTLDIDADGPFNAQFGDRFQILEFNTISGAFSGVTQDTPAFGGIFDLQDLYTTGEIVFRRAGDLNTDGFVGAEDLDILLAAWGDSVSPFDFTGGDLTGDGTVGTADLQIVLNNWGTGTPAGGNVPEPGSLAILGLVGLALLKHRRR